MEHMRNELREATDSRDQLIRDCRAKDTQLKKCRLYIDELRKGVSGSSPTMIVKSRCVLRSPYQRRKSRLCRRSLRRGISSDEEVWRCPRSTVPS